MWWHILIHASSEQILNKSFQTNGEFGLSRFTVGIFYAGGVLAGSIALLRRIHVDHACVIVLPADLLAAGGRG